MVEYVLREENRLFYNKRVTEYQENKEESLFSNS
jgi:hypothetical protein